MCYNKVKTIFKKVNVKIMPITYNKLWKLLIDKNMTKTDLKNITGMNSVTLANMGKNKFISLRMIDKICKELDCQIEDVVEFVREVK